MKVENTMKLPATSENLVIVRAGNTSLHGGWMGDKYADRNWDIVVSYFDHDSFLAHEAEAGVVSVFLPGGKWDGIFTTISGLENIGHYEYVWLPDDDIEADCETINRMFAMMREYDLSVAQPSLSSDSYFTSLHVAQIDQFILRYSNFVEIMVPCLRKDVLEYILPDFEFTLSGYGLDSVWHRLEAIDNRAAILDSISVRHTRPVGSKLRTTVTERGTTPKKEGKVLRAKYGGLPSALPSTYSAVCKESGTIEDVKKLAFIIAQNQLKTNYTTLSKLRKSRKIMKLFLSHLTRKIKLSPLRRATL